MKPINAGAELTLGFLILRNATDADWQAILDQTAKHVAKPVLRRLKKYRNQSKSSQGQQPGVTKQVARDLRRLKLPPSLPDSQKQFEKSPALKGLVSTLEKVEPVSHIHLVIG